MKRRQFWNFFLTNSTTVKGKNVNLRYLTPEEFDAVLLKKLTEEGRVFISCPRIINRDAYKREVLDYVRTINDFVTDEWRDGIDGLWQEIVEAECFRDCLAMKKGPQAGHMNRYRVTMLVSWMQGGRVYRSDISMQSLHLHLEHATKRNKYYTSCNNYCLTKDAKKLLRQLFLRV